MIRKKADVGVDGSAAMLDVYAFAPEEDAYARTLKPAVVIVPGGGYNHVSPREGEPIALRLLADGYQSFVLDYSVAPAVYPQALRELAAAVAWVRGYAEELQVDPARVSVAGFSAGGHLACLLGAKWGEPGLAESVGATAAEIKPDALCLGYPVVTAGAFAHRGSFETLSGGDEELTRGLSIEKLVSADFPRTFVWHTAEDGSVPVQNSLLLAEALAGAGVPFSLHVFPHGPHGIALANETTAFKGRAEQVQPQAQAWPEMFAAWERDA